MSSRWDTAATAEGSSASPGGAAKSDAAAAAAAAAAKIAAQLAPPRVSPSKEAENSSAAEGSKKDHGKEKDAHDAEFTHDIEINDQRNRYMLTKGQTQQMVHRETGASVTTKGTWYPDKSLATKEDPPLYLHISATSKDILDAAIAKIEELMNQEMPQLVEDRHQKRLDYENQRPPPRERRRWPEEKLPINLESIRNFNVRSKIVGPGGMFVKYIQNETGTRVQIKGIGSGFIETETGQELQEPMHIAIAGPEEAQIKEAKTLAEDLLEVVRSEWHKASNAINGSGYGGGGGGGYGGGPRGGAPGYGRGDGGYGGGGYGQQHQHGGWEQHQQGGWNGHGQDGMSSGYAQPPAPDGAPPPPPPEDDAPPPPPADSGYAGVAQGPSSHRDVDRDRGRGSQNGSTRDPRYDSARSNSSPSRSRDAPNAAAEPARQSQSKAAMSPEEEALDKYWREYVQWEDSFKAYHNRLPSKDEGGQDVPAQYRKK